MDSPSQTSKAGRLGFPFSKATPKNLRTFDKQHAYMKRRDADTARQAKEGKISDVEAGKRINAARTSDRKFTIPRQRTIYPGLKRPGVSSKDFRIISPY
jgi:hypothetical protein